MLFVWITQYFNVVKRSFCNLDVNNLYVCDSLTTPHTRDMLSSERYKAKGIQEPSRNNGHICTRIENCMIET
jgi:hypothetical protein